MKSDPMSFATTKPQTDNARLSNLQQDLARVCVRFHEPVRISHLLQGKRLADDGPLTYIRHKTLR